MDMLVVLLLRLFRRFSRDDSLVELREFVSFVKSDIRPQMPVKLAAELYNRVLKEFSSPSDVDLFPPRCHVEIVSQVLVDDDIAGLECSSEIFASLQPDDAVRIRGLSKLELYDSIPHNLETLDMEHLTVFVYNYRCIDSDLTVLGQRCPKLRHVDLSKSHRITNAGLCALATCSDLVFLKVSQCPKISLSGLKHFLSMNKSIRELFAWSDNDDAGFDFGKDQNWDEDPSVYPSVTSFTIGKCFSNSHLMSVVSKFPNLRSVKLYESFKGDISALKSLRNLSIINFVAGSGSSWAGFEALLEIVGTRIEQLIVRCRNISLSQMILYSVFQRCKNLESLRLDSEVGSDQDKLVVPPFERLKYSKFTLSDDYMTTLELSQMTMLENLRVFDFAIGESRVISMIVDPISFPNLKEIALSEFWVSTDFDSVEQIAKSNNIDLKLVKLADGDD